MIDPGVTSGPALDPLARDPETMAERR